MNSVLIDSDILIEVSRERDDLILKRWRELAEGQTAVLCTAVTVAELWHGARAQEFAKLKALFLTIDCVPIDLRIAQHAGDYLRVFAASHGLELGDAFIAATASIHELLLWTRNQKHYPMKDIAFY